MNVLIGNTQLQKKDKIRRKKRPIDDEQSRTLYTMDELLELDGSEMPKPSSEEHITGIEEAIYKEYHEENCVCVVCDEIRPESQTHLLAVADLPPAFFKILKPPSDKTGKSFTLDRRLILQYDVSNYFPGDHRFKSLLLSPRGDEICEEGSSSSAGDNIAKMRICNDCFKSLRKSSIPKFAIANGNWIGQLPTQLRNMTFGSRCLIRPVQSFGRMASFYHGSGTRLTGHVYSNKLNTPLVRQKVPIPAAEVPVRVVVLSPFTSDTTAILRGKIASIREDYVIEREKIDGALRFFKLVGNRIIAQVECDSEVMDNLPCNDVSVDMFLMDNHELATKNSDKCCSPEDLQTELNDDTGGPSLSRCNEENDEAIFVSSTVTIGAPESNDKNMYEQVVEVLDNFTTATGNFDISFVLRTQLNTFSHTTIDRDRDDLFRQRRNKC